MGTLGNRIKERLKEIGMSQTRLAELLGVNRAAVVAWIKGTYEPGVKKSYRMCMVLDCSMDWLITGYERSALDAYRRAKANFANSGKMAVNEAKIEYAPEAVNPNDVRIIAKFLKLSDHDKKIINNLIESMLKEG